MVDVAKVLIGIARGDFDENLGDIADALTLRGGALVENQIAAAGLAAYMRLTGVSLDKLIGSTEEN